MAFTFSRILSTLIVLLIPILQTPSYAQNTQNTQPPPLSTAEIEQLVAPVALYPDALLAQVLMAATYPIQVVDAARWRATLPKNLSDEQLSALVQDQPWDPSVKSLTAFPSVLDMMDDNLDWTGELGNAFLDQQQDVMDAVQRLRTQAHAAGNLQSGPQQTVYASGDPPIIVIQPTHPDTVYVPVYNPGTVYGVWAYPSYPPYYWQPPSYSPGGTILSFTAGLFVGNALWGYMDWHRHDVTINVERYNTYNHTHITSNRWQRPPQRGRWRAGDYRRNPGQRSLSGSGAADQRTNSQRPNLPNARPKTTGEQRGASQPGTQTRRSTSQRPTAASDRPDIPRPAATRQRPNIQRPAATQRRPDTPRPAAAPQRPNIQRPAAAPRPQAAPERPNIQRPAAAPQRPSTQGSAAAPARPSAPRPAASSERRDSPRAASSEKRRGNRE